jgi:trimeric autotransporter adhesin
MEYPNNDLLMRKLRPFGSFFTFIATCLLTVPIVAQNITKQFDLNAFAEQKRAESQINKETALKYAQKYNLPVTISTETTYSELIGITATNVPQYYTITNKNSAATISTDKLKTKSLAAYSLDGSGMTVYEWDAGAPLMTHQELTGRVISGDGAASNFHSTHIAGTLIASGVQEQAKGMAPAANLIAYEWNNDVSEMAVAALNGALVSNHSYGFLRGWAYNGNGWSWYGDTTISNKEDYLFGFYDEQARDWDEIAYNAPWYLIVKSAGNDRNEGPSYGTIPKDGPFDCISNAGVAKNVLTVGAVDALPDGYSSPSEVRMSSFSNWGPTDDGRVKPDIVADGIGIYSTNNGGNADYITLSGTSMSTASVTGSLLLLQQLAFDLNKSYLKAATLKGLVIATADEVGPENGPDYQSGWGLMDTYKAAELLVASEDMPVITEETLNEGDVFTKDIVATGDEPLKITICWTDVPGVSPEPSLDPSDAMLVNDLDLSVTANGITWYPWSLNAAFPSMPATATGKNHADNVEVVLIPQAGNVEYTISVGHSGNLSGGSQAFSMIISGAGTVSANEQHGDPQGIYDGNKGNERVKVYPNPVQNITTIETPGMTGGTISLYDNSGRNILSKPQSGEQTQMDLSGLPGGSYIVLIKNNETRRIARVTKKL